ncbi:MAG: hypothetical protein HYY17_11880 [Planctomycetes bacterium]|nr:hypothetical protein [Planctomycetota bacterium]
MLGILATTALLAQEDLSEAYERARRMIQRFPSGGSEGWDWNEPTWSPSFGDEVPATPPPSAVDRAVEERIASDRKRVARLKSGREKLRVAVEKIRRNEAWKIDLEYFVEESQLAQLGALKACVSLLAGAAGPLDAAAQGEKFHALEVVAEKLARRLQPIRAVLDRVARHPKAAAAVEEMRRAIEMLAAALRSKGDLRTFCAKLDKFAQHAMLAANVLELLHDAAVKQDLALCIKDVEDIAVDALKEAGLVYLKKVGMEEAARVSKLAIFLVTYGYQSVRFFEAWGQVDSVLAQIEDRAATLRSLGDNIVRMTNRVREIETEIDDLNRLQGASVEAKRQKLYELRAREHQVAHRMGEWYSNESGVRARGEPIDPGKE